MTPIHWIIEQTDHFTNDVAQRLAYVVAEMGHPVTIFRYIPFEGTDYSFLPPPEAGPAFFYGTWNALADIRRRVADPPRPFAYCDFDRLRCSSYYPHLARFLLQQTRWEGTLAELVAGVDAIYAQLGVDGCVFIRPDDNEKSFDGGVVHRDLFVGWIAHARSIRMVPEATRVVVAEAQRIDAEWRFAIVDGRVVAGSRYRTGGVTDIASEYDRAAAAQAEQAAATWSPHPVFVVDVGRVGAEDRVIEIGPINYAGLYRMDLRAVVRAVNDWIISDDGP